MNSLIFLFMLIIHYVYAEGYNPCNDTYDNLINVLLSLIIYSAYKSRMKEIVGRIEGLSLGLLLLVFPVMYNFFLYKSTSKYDYLCVISSLFIIPIYILSFISVKPFTKFMIRILIIFIMPTLTFTIAIFWIRKDIMSKKIGYELFAIITSIFGLILFTLFLFGRLYLGLYFYMIVSVGLSFSIAYSNSFFFTKLALEFISYFLARVFDMEALLVILFKVHY